MTFSLSNKAFYMAAFALMALIIGTCVILTFSPLFNSDRSTMSMAITIDLVITAPLVYFLLIRKKSISKITVIPWIIFGLVIASLILPPEEQFFPSLFKTYLIPVIELGLIGSLLIKLRKMVQEYRLQKTDHPDFLSLLRKSATTVLGEGLFTQVLISEIALFYYALFSWKKKLPLNEMSFSYHKNNGLAALTSVFIFLVAAETVAFHLLLALWKPWVAWVFTGSSIYVILWLVAHFKASKRRPILLLNNLIQIRNGLMGDTEIPLAAIESIAMDLKTVEQTQLVKKIGLDQPNLAITLSGKNTITGPYGRSIPYQTLLIKLDDPLAFQKMVKERINQNDERQT